MMASSEAPPTPDRAKCKTLAQIDIATASNSVARNQWLAFYVANDMGLDDELTLALFEAAWTESGFHNWANPRVPASLAIGNDGLGQDHNSVGVLQQQVQSNGESRGWGSVSDAMNPEGAMRVFAQRSEGAKHRGSGADKVAQDVQRSAFANAANYRSHQSAAQDLINRMTQGCSR